MADNKIHVTNLKKSFGKLEVLKDISMDITEGEVVVLLGPSGSGKSTFLRCLNQLETATAGQILIDGYDVTDKHTDINKVRQNIGMVFQHFNLFNHLNVMDNMTLAPVHLKVMTKDEARKKAMELLTRVGLADKAEAFPSQLSGGQKQRLCIARALLGNAKILIFDDSTSAVDTATEKKIRKALADYKDVTKIIIAQRITSVMNTDQIVILDDGKVHCVGTHKELLANDSIYQEIYASQMKGGNDDGSEE